jgi:gliding motility-associated-like protein
VAQASLPVEVPVDGDGNFSHSLALNVGDNEAIVSSTDIAGNETTVALMIEYRPSIIAAEGGTVYLPERKDDGIESNDTRVVIPPDAAREDFFIEITQLESESVPAAVDNPYIGRGAISPLVVYEFFLGGKDGQPLSMVFTKPIEIYLQYQGLRELDGSVVVFRWDGVRWNPVGGEEDRGKDIVKITVNSLSIFGIFEGAVVPKEFELSGAFPNPFTPNSDGINDAVSFYFSNPSNADTMIRIFDLRGALVRKLENGLTSWDGLDDAGQAVEMGVYIYQIEVESEFEGGTIVIAR